MELNFATSFEKMNNIYSDLLIDILAWEMVIINKMAAKEAEQAGRSHQEQMEKWESLKLEARTHVLKEIYGKHGPDLSGELKL